MKILWMGFLGNNHSWSICGQNICRTFINKGHDVHMVSTNGIKHFPQDLKPYLKAHVEERQQVTFNQIPIDQEYDLAISYTALRNFPAYLSRGKKKFGIWCYEFAGKNSFPEGFAKQYKFSNKIFPPSEFAKRVFLENGVPESHLKVIPHGIDFNNFNATGNKLKLNTNKSVKILCNIAQPHIRKNLGGVLDTYGKAFTKHDDVCLVVKVVDKPVTQPFEVSFKDLFNDFKKKYKDAGEVIILREYIDNIADLYRACDIVFSIPRSECFWFPGLEALGCRNVVVATGWGGQLDYLNDSNSLLVTGKEVRAPANALYWHQKPNTIYFEPDINDAVDKLRYAVNNLSALKTKFYSQDMSWLNKYTWDNVVDEMIKEYHLT